MSLAAMMWALKKAPVGADCTARLLLTQLADRADERGRGAFPSASTLAAEMHVSVRTVRRQLQELEAAGVIRRGDQQMVAHLRGGHKPVVWDLCLGCEKRPANRGVTICHPSETGGTTDVREVTPVSPLEAGGDTESTMRGDISGRCGVTRVSPKPKHEPNITTNPPTVPPRGTSDDDGDGGVSSLAEWLVTEGSKAGIRLGLRPRDRMALASLLLDRGAARIHAVVRWAWAQDFWRSRLRTVSAIARNFDMLDAQCSADAVKGGGTPEPKDPHAAVPVMTLTDGTAARMPVYGFSRLGLERSREHFDNVCAADECPVCRFDPRNRVYHGDERARLLPAMREHPSHTPVSVEFGGAA